MKAWLTRLSGLALFVAVCVSVVTSLPTWMGGHLGDNRLLAHMMASGVIVVLLPVYGWLRLVDWLAEPRPTAGESLAFWSMMLFGFLTIATMFVCMTPMASTASMRELIDLHGWVGGVLALSLVVHAWHAIRGRKPSTV